MMVSGQSAAMPTVAVSASIAHSRMRRLYLNLKQLKMKAAKVGIDCAHPPHLVEECEEAAGFIAGVEIRAAFIAIGQFALDVADAVHYQQRLVVFPILVRWLANLDETGEKLAERNQAVAVFDGLPRILHQNTYGLLPGTQGQGPHRIDERLLIVDRLVEIARVDVERTTCLPHQRNGGSAVVFTGLQVKRFIGDAELVRLHVDHDTTIAQGSHAGPADTLCWRGLMQGCVVQVLPAAQTPRALD